MPRHLDAKREQSEGTSLHARKQSYQLIFITSLVFVGIIGAAIALIYIGNKSHEYQEQNWYSAVATIKDARTQLVSQVNGRQGGAMLYEVQVLATFSANGSPQERWITVDQDPKNLDYAEFQGRVWKGKQYFVRWKPSDPNVIVIDLH
jgi:flagellar basal body-associated protein FliL